MSHTKFAAAREQKIVGWLARATTDAGSTVQVLAFTKDEAERAMRMLPNAIIVPLIVMGD
jgi:hypothetical protein